MRWAIIVVGFCMFTGNRAAVSSVYSLCVGPSIPTESRSPAARDPGRSFNRGVRRLEDLISRDESIRANIERISSFLRLQNTGIHD
jgi:hypothetical protein